MKNCIPVPVKTAQFIITWNSASLLSFIAVKVKMSVFALKRMKVFTCEIAWHNKEPVYSLDFQHGTDGKINRLASAGVDTAVRVSHKH